MDFQENSHLRISSPSEALAACGYATLDLNMSLKITCSDDRLVPSYGSVGAAGLDLKSSVTTYIAPGEKKLIKTGVSVQLLRSTVGLIASRSGLALKNGIIVLNQPGIIDEDYRGEIGVILWNTNKIDFKVNFGDRIAQLIVSPYIKVNVEKVGSLSQTSRQAGGFGSTGVSTTTLS